MFEELRRACLAAVPFLALAGPAAAYAVSDTVTATLRYDGSIGARDGDHRASARLSILF